MGAHRTLVLAAALGATLSSSDAALGYTIGTSATPYCHERITVQALGFLGNSRSQDLPVALGPLGSRGTRAAQLARHLRAKAGSATAPPGLEGTLDGLLIAVRAPDVSDAHVLNLERVRELHMAPESQAGHFLRSPGDDRAEGGAHALQAARAFLREKIVTSRGTSARDRETSADIDVYVEYHGRQTLSISRALIPLGQALHAFQDSFSHSYRSADTFRIATLATYVDALSTDYDEGRDGPRHSTALDDCDRAGTAALVRAAIQGTAEVLDATATFWLTGEMAPVDAVLDRWLGAEPGPCTLDNDYCASPWVSEARQGETHQVLDCALKGAGLRSDPWWAPLLTTASIVVAAALRRFQRRDPAAAERGRRVLQR